MNVHFIAIGGAAMHNLAIALHKKGYKVTGSDDEIFDPSKSRLQKYGLLPKTFGWFPDKITHDLDAIILGMHAQIDNPELKKAQELGLRIYSYPEYLYEQNKDKKRVVIAGSHGKTTITSMILYVLDAVHKPVNFMVGSQLSGFETMVQLDDNLDTIVLEGDEYLSSPLDARPKILWYKPHITVISGIAWDHMNKFPKKEDYHKIFSDYLNEVEPGGSVIYFEEDPVLNKIVLSSEHSFEKIAYRTPDYKQADNTYALMYQKESYPMQVFGKHNMQNMEAARQVCLKLGVNNVDFYKAMQSFTGADKRLEKIYDNGNTLIFKDFAHAPSKVQASLEAVKDTYPDKKVIAVLELHTYSSLNQKFLPEYKDKLARADEAIVFYSPHAVQLKRLSPIPPELIVREFNRPDLKVYTQPELLHEYLYNLDLDNTVLLMMSSGNYGGLDLGRLG